jgi:pimeloyl-ACP methyl ester carboxylesterase
MSIPLIRLVTAFAIGLGAAAMRDAPATAQSGAAANTVGAVAQLAGRRIWYLDTGGSGIPIVFMHPGSGSSSVWEHQIPAVRAAGYRFIAYDRLGSGRSVLEPGSDPGFAIDDLHALLEYLRIDRFHLVGTAAGGIVPLDYALSFPERVRSLVVANSIGGVQDEDYLALGRRIRPSPQFDALPTEFKELGPSYRAANAKGTALEQPDIFNRAVLAFVAQHWP